MPFKSNQELVKKVKGTSKLSEKKKSQWRAVFNKCFEKHGDDGSCYAQAWGAVKKSSSMDRMAASELFRIAKEVEFIFERLKRQLWRDKVLEAQKRQDIVFDLENDDSVDDPEIVKVGEHENTDGEMEPYKFIVQLCQAGGDWQNPVVYWRIQLHPKSPLLSVEHFKFNDDNCMVFIPVNGNNSLTFGEKGLVPTEVGDFVEWDDDALRADLIAFLEKLTEADKGVKEFEDWEEGDKVGFENGRVARELLRMAKGFLDE